MSSGNADTNSRRRAAVRRPAASGQRQASEAGHSSSIRKELGQDNSPADVESANSAGQRRRPINSSAKSMDQMGPAAGPSVGAASLKGEQASGDGAAKVAPASATRNKPSLAETKASPAPAPSAGRTSNAAASELPTMGGPTVKVQEAAYLNQSSSSGTQEVAGAGAGPLNARSESTQHLTANMEDDLCVVENVNDDEVLSPEDGGSFGVRRHLTAGLTKNLIWAVFVSTVGSSFQHGYNGGVVNAPERLIGQFVNATYLRRHGEAATEAQIDLIIAIIVSIFCIGGCVGALMTALVADRLGRKEGLLYNNIMVLIASPMMAVARSMSSYELLILGRFLIGINAGLNAGLAPLYLNEIAPIQLRGALGTIYQLVITISILLSNIFGLPSLLGDEHSWPILFALPIIPAAFMLIALPHCYESPKHLLLNQGKELQAQQALAWFRETGDVQEEMDELRSERELNLMTNRTITLGDMLNEQSLRRPLTIAIVIMLSQQLSGINAVLFFSTSIFRDAGLGEQAAVRATLGMGIVNVAMTLVSLFLVDRVGRRTLHMTGLMGMAATCLVLAVCLQGGSTPLNTGLAVVAVYIFIAMFASGPGAIPWFLVAELFPSNARPLASSIAVAVNWLANFCVSLCFLPLSNVLHGFTFVLFAILLVIFYLFTYYKVPETKGATAEEISALFKR